MRPCNLNHFTMERGTVSPRIWEGRTRLRNNRLDLSDFLTYELYVHKRAPSSWNPMMDVHSAKKIKKHFEWSNSALNRKTHWQEISCQHSPCTDPKKTHEEREKTGWKEKEKLGILWTQRHASKQQVLCERAVGESIYMFVHNLHTLWAAVCQWSGEEVVCMYESLVDPVDHTSCGPPSHLEETY